MNEHKFLNAVGNISDEYLLEALSYRERKKMVKNFSKAAAAILLAIIITGLSLNVFMPIYARNLPFVGNAFAFIQDRLHTGGAYSNYAFKIGDDEDISSQGEYGRTSGITQIPRIRVNNDLHIYVVNSPTLGEDGLSCGTQKVSKEHAIVSADIKIDK